MIKQLYDNRVDEILDNLKNRIIEEKFAEHLENFLREVNNGIY